MVWRFKQLIGIFKEKKRVEVKNLNLGEKTAGITEAALITAFTTLFVIISFNFFPIIILFYPVPFIILGVRHVTKYNIYGILASSILIGILIDIFTGIFTFLIFGLISITITYMINKKYKYQEIILGGVLVAIISLLLGLVVISQITGISFLTEVTSLLTESAKHQIELVKEMGFSNYEMSLIEDYLMSTVKYLIIIIPASLIISLAFIVFMNYWMAGAILKRTGHKNINTPKFTEFSLPSNIIMGSIVIVVLSLLIRYMKILYYETIFINTIILISFVFFLQGLSVIAFIMNKRGMHKFVKIILMFLLIVNVLLTLVVIFIGLLDVILDFRKLRQKE